MTTYRIEFTAPVVFYAEVEAASESAARQAYIDGDVDTWDIASTLDSFDDVTAIASLGAHAVTAIGATDVTVHAEDCDLDEDCTCGASDD